MSLDPGRVQTVFSAALEAPDALARTAVLDQECAGDPELRREVEALLQAHEHPASILEQPVGPPFDAGTQPYGAAEANDAERPAISLSFLQPSGRTDSLGRLGHYEVLEVLGRGGFGIVLRAFDERLERVVAIKVLAPELAATSPARKRFLREARAAAAVRHENVVQIYAVEEEPTPYLVMEFIPGQTLQRQLDDYGPLETKEMLRLAVQIARGIAAAHAQGLIHRDIKPGNILLEGETEPRVKITDFGLARTADDASVTQSGAVAGTPMYMAPEQASANRVDQRADLFSLGSVFYVMLSGRPPFRAANTPAVLMRVVEDRPRPITEIIPEAPPWLCDLIGKLHAKKPDDRFQSAAEVADLLQKCLAELQVRGNLTQLPRIPVPNSKMNSAKSRPPSVWVAVVSATLLALAALYYALAGLNGFPGQTRQVSRSGVTEPSTTKKDPEVTPVDDPWPQFVDSRAYLPLSEGSPRKVLDFKEIHGATPEAVVHWAESLEPGYVPISLGKHASPNSLRAHALAVKLGSTILQFKSSFGLLSEDGPIAMKIGGSGYYALQAQYFDVPDKGKYILRFWLRDPGFPVGYWALPNHDWRKVLAQHRQQHYKPFLFQPREGADPNLILTHFMSDAGRNKWRAEAGLSRDDLVTVANDAMAADQFVSVINAYQGENGETQFGLVAWENPGGLDWVFKSAMTTREYEAELAKHKQGGLRPVSVTSHDDHGTTLYAASWVRFRRASGQEGAPAQ